MIWNRSLVFSIGVACLAGYLILSYVKFDPHPERSQATSVTGVGETIRELHKQSTTTYPWPFAPQCRPHPVALHYHAIYRPSSDTAYLHGGIDLQAPPGTPVLAVATGHLEIYRQEGFDNAILTEPTGEVWEYRHLTPNSTPSEVLDLAARGEAIAVGASIGTVGRWSTNYSHLHLNRRSAVGCIINPLTQLHPVRDTTPPVIRGVYFVAEGTGVPIAERGGRPLVRGPVDIVVDAIDVIDGSRYGSPPIEVNLRWNSSEGTHRLHFRPFRTQLPEGCTPAVPRYPREGIECFMRRGPLASKNHIPHDPEQRFCLIVTNVDSEGRPSEAGSWNPQELGSGVHVVHVEAVDEAGNRSEVSVSVEISRH